MTTPSQTMINVESERLVATEKSSPKVTPGQRKARKPEPYCTIELHRRHSINSAVTIDPSLQKPIHRQPRKSRRGDHPPTNGKHAKENTSKLSPHKFEQGKNNEDNYSELKAQLVSTQEETSTPERGQTIVFCSAPLETDKEGSSGSTQLTVMSSEVSFEGYRKAKKKKKRSSSKVKKARTAGVPSSIDDPKDDGRSRRSGSDARSDSTAESSIKLKGLNGTKECVHSLTPNSPKTALQSTPSFPNIIDVSSDSIVESSVDLAAVQGRKGRTRERSSTPNKSRTRSVPNVIDVSSNSGIESSVDLPVVQGGKGRTRERSLTPKQSNAAAVPNVIGVSSNSDFDSLYDLPVLQRKCEARQRSLTPNKSSVSSISHIIDESSNSPIESSLDLTIVQGQERKARTRQRSLTPNKSSRAMRRTSSVPNILDVIPPDDRQLPGRLFHNNSRLAAPSEQSGFDQNPNDRQVSHVHPEASTASALETPVRSMVDTMRKELEMYSLSHDPSQTQDAILRMRLELDAINAKQQSSSTSLVRTRSTPSNVNQEWKPQQLYDSSMPSNGHLVDSNSGQSIMRRPQQLHDSSMSSNGHLVDSNTDQRMMRRPQQLHDSSMFASNGQFVDINSGQSIMRRPQQPHDSWMSSNGNLVDRNTCQSIMRRPQQLHDSWMSSDGHLVNTSNTGQSIMRRPQQLHDSWMLSNDHLVVASNTSQSIMRRPQQLHDSWMSLNDSVVDTSNSTISGSSSSIFQSTISSPDVKAAGRRKLGKGIMRRLFRSNSPPPPPNGSSNTTLPPNHHQSQRHCYSDDDVAVPHVDLNPTRNEETQLRGRRRSIATDAGNSEREMIRIQQPLERDMDHLYRKWDELERKQGLIRRNVSFRQQSEFK